jgi:hypothetical protein
MLNGTKLDCPERDRLWKQYNHALDTLTQCVNDLENASPTSLSSKIISSSAASKLFMAARENWEEHLRLHQCDKIM